jgi:hypothetical protein
LRLIYGRSGGSAPRGKEKSPHWILLYVVYAQHVLMYGKSCGILHLHTRHACPASYVKRQKGRILCTKRKAM